MIELGESLPTIDTPRLALRWIRAEDAGDMFAIFSNPEVMRYWARPPMKVLAEAEKYISEIQGYFKAKTGLQWGITKREDGRVIGTCTLWKIELDNRRCEIGYALKREEWGRGIASEAVGALIDFALEKLNLHRIEADVDPRNDRSIVMLEKMAFKREGFLPERYHVAGEVQDTVLLGLLAPAWRAHRAGVRPMQAEDRGRVLSMLAVQLEEHNIPIQRDVLMRAIDGVAENPQLGAFLVLDRGQGPIGVAYLGFTWTLELGGLVSWLEELYVMPEHRGQGFGAALLEGATAFAKSRGARGLDLEVETGHERAANLYIRAGFRRLSRTRWQKRFAAT